MNSKGSNIEESLRDITNKHSLWIRFQRERKTVFKDSEITFLTECMKENLAHARHVENERLTFNSVFMALVAGSFALGECDLSGGNAILLIYVMVAVAGSVSIVLTNKWNNAFDRHMFFAQQCYKMIHISLFGGKGSEPEGTKEIIEGLSDIPMYCFKIDVPDTYNKYIKKIIGIRTRSLYMLFYILIEISLIAYIVYNIKLMLYCGCVPQ